MSEKQSERSDSVSVTSDHSKGGGPNFSEETPSAIESERSDLSSSVSVKSDRSKGGGPNFREETPSATERSDSDVSSSVSVKSNRSKDGEGPNFREETPSATERHFISVRSDSDVSSSVSVKSNRSKDGEGPNFREETPSATESVRSVSHVSSSVSVKSDRSKGGGPNFREETPSATESVRSDSDVSSSVSVKSNRSKDGEGPNFREETPSATERHFISLHVSSSVSVKSNRSKDGEGPNFREETPSATERKKSFMKSDHSKGGGPNSSHRKTSSTKRERSGSVESSLVSMRSDRSKDGTLPSFNEKTTSTKSSKEQNTTVNIGAEIVRWESLKVQKGMNSDVELASFLLNRIQYEKKTDFQSYRFKKFRENLIWVFQDLENKIIVFLKNELERFKKILKKENTQYFVQDFIEDMCSIKEAALDITLHFLKIMKQHELADTLKDELVFIHQRQLKSNLKKKYQCVFEGIAKQGDSTLLNSIYTDLYITQGGSEQVNTQHEVRQIEISRRAESQEIQIECTNLFESPEQGKEIRTVLTKGVAGIGKSISVQKFILDWAEEKENQDISFIFPLPFREMNLKEEEKQSLMNLVSQFFPEVKGLNLTRNDKFKVLFILDGLDECRLPLNFKDNETWRDVSSPASLDVLLTNLIRGNLLPSALIWITTRPAAASRIPQDCIDRVTEVRGFNDAQKEEYFNKRFTDKKMAEDIIDHVKKSKSLFIMCHIPVFCWISATVLQNILEEKRNNDVKNNQADDTSETLQESNTEDTPKTLTQMYTHFLRFQIQQSRSKYDGEYTPDVSWDKDAILSLGKLAFHQLERNNLIFYDTDLEACGIDASKALVYSGMCTQIFKEETGIILGTMYCFVHMSIQEFIAALYAHLFLDSNKKNVFDQESTEQRNKNEAMIDLLKTAVDKALTSEIGHLDLFLRFLLGLSLESNHPLLRGLLTQQDSNDQSNKDIVKYIKQKLGENLSPERSINLFYCLNELNEKTLVEDIQTQLREGSLSSADLSPAQWSAVAFVLLTSEKELENFELQEFKKSDECLIRLSAVIKTSKRALLNDCNLTDKSCSALATVLGSDTNLKELNMNNNNLQDSGVALLCTGLKSVKCKLETLWLNKCDLTKESCSALASVLSSDSSSLKDLELSNNNLQDSGVKLLCDGLKNNRKLEKIRLSDCGITEEGYKALASALRSNPLSHLIELDLTGNDPGQSGVKELSNLLQDPDCQLKMSSDSSSLKNLELSNNNLQDSGVKPPCDGLKNNRKLEKIRFLGPDAEEACKYLTEDLHIKNLLLLSELNLSRRELGDTQVNQIAALLKDKHCTLNTLKMNNNSITAEGCAALTSAFNSNPSNLIELDLSGNKLGNSGIEEICPLLENTQCRLMKLKLSDCSITEEGYKSLASALRSNPSHLTELDLTGNDPGQSGVKELNDLLQEEHCKLKSRFLKIPAAQEACEYLTNVLSISPLLLTELDLSEDKLGDLDGEKLSALLKDSHSKVVKIKLNNCEQTEKSCSVLATVLSSKTILKELNLNSSRLLDSGVKEICEGLKNPVCKLEILKLSDCSISEEGYKALASALRSNPSHLIELDLTGNDPGQSGVKELDDLLQDQNCQLKILTFLGPIADEACKYLTEDLHIKNPLLLRELILSGHELGDTRVNQIAALLQDKHCKLYTLMLCNCGLTEESCLALATVLTSNSSLKELDISSNNLQDSGVKKLQNALENTNCTLEKLRLSDCSITEEGYKALASALRSNPSHLIELDLTGNDPGQSGVKELDDLLQDQNCQLKILTFLGPIADEACKYLTEDLHIKNPLLLRELNLSGHELGDTRVNQIAALLQDKHCKLNTLMLCNCGLTEESCLALATVLTSNSSLKELDISSNNLQDSGVKKLQNALENTNCTLEKLRLSDCSITEEGYKALASALRSNPSHLIELDLTGNDPGQSGVKELDDLLQDQNCQLKILTFLGPIADEACKYLTEDLHIKNPLLLRELNLSGHELGDTRVNQIAALLQDKHCKLNTLMLCNCGLTEESCLALATVLTSNSSLKELDISSNNLQDSGVKKLQNALENTNCTLEKLRLSDCSITEEGYKALASALRSNPSHLIELDLTGNDPGQSGVKELDDLLQDENCELKTLRFLSPPADEACQIVNRVLCENLLLLRELNLSEHKLGPSGLKKLAAVLPDKHCKLNTLILNNSNITDEDCRVLTEALNSNPSNLTELNLSRTKLRDSGLKIFSALFKNEQCQLEKLKLNCSSVTAEGCSVLASAFCLNLKELELNENKLGNSGVTEISTLLGNSQCTLKILRLSDCSITEEGYKALASALKSNPSHLIELDLTGNDPGQSGVKELDDFLHDENCQLKTLRFLGPAADEACQYVRGIVGKNPLLLRKLKLSGCELGDTQVNQIAALLQDKHCTVNRLLLNNNSITAEGCAALTSAFNSNPSNLIELDLSGNKLGNSGIMKICHLLENTECRLMKLKLSDCSITEEGYKTLTSSLKSNSNLIELDLTANNPGRSGVKGLIDLLRLECCELKTIRFLKSPAAQEACDYLTEVLGKSPLLLTELDLSEDKLGDLDGEKLSALLMDSHSKVEIIKLNNCKLIEKICSVLATVLSTKTILKELNLNNSHLLDSGVKEICEGLKKSTLKILKLSNCSITEEGYKALASALKSNSHLLELDLTGNDPGRSGVKELIDLQSWWYSFKRLRTTPLVFKFLGPDADKACQYLTGIVGENPLLLSELNLNGRKLGDTRVNQIAALLQDKHCKLNTLKLCDCGLTEENCSALATVLTSNSSLKELDISSNNLQDSGVKKLQNAFENTNCTLEKLRLSDCSITEEGYKALASALRSNPSSHLIELDLTGNDPGQSGVKELNDLLQDDKCQLKTLRFLGPAADEACQYVREIVGENPLLLSELNLSERKLGNGNVNQITALLQDKHCTVKTLMLNNNRITAEGCAALTSAFNSNPSNLIELDLSGNKLENSGMEKICHLFKNTQCRLERLKLCDCGLTEENCSALATVLRSNSSLKELDISNNNLQDSGVKKLQNALENTNCTLEKLRLSDCSIREEGYKALASALRSNPSHLIELDLTGNDPGQSGVKELDDLLRDQKCQLNTLRFLGRDADEACQFVTGIVVKNPLLLRELNLSERELGDRNVKQIAALLQDKHCTVKTLQMNNNSITAEGCAALTSAFNSNPSNLIELDLSGNKLGNSGMEKICLLLKKTQCKMEKLKLSDCSITEEGYKALASALRSNPSHLTELDLTGNDPGQSGVKELNNLLQDEHCSLKSIKFLKSTAAMEVCEYLTKVLGKSPLLLTELDLSEVKLGDLDGEKFSALLMDSHSKVEKIKLNNCKLTEKSCSVLATVLSSKTILKELNLNNSRLLDSRVKEICEGLKKSTLKILKLSECDLTEESCSALASVLSSDSSYLKDLDLSNNNLQDSVVKLFSDGLKNNCKLEKLRLSDCSITEEGYKALASALRSNPSHLIELDLTGNDPGQSGVKELNDLLQNQNCQLKTLRFLGPAADEACQYLIGIMGKNPLILRELNLSECELKDTRVHQIAALLKDKHCKLNTLILNNSDITAEDCCVLTEALNTNPSNLTELNLSGTKLRDSGMKIFSTLFENEQCRLEKLKIKCISITAEGCAALTSAFNSNPSNLIELDLSGNKLGNSGVTQISTLLGNSECALQILRLSICSITEEGYKALASALRSNPSHLIELDLTGNDPGQSGVKELDDLLQDQNCQLKTLRFLGPEADKACQYIRGIVGENPLLLRALNLSERKLRDTRVNQIAALLKDKHCTVNTLMLNNNSITAEGCVALTSAFNSNPSNLKELDLSGNKLGNSGIEKICHLLENIQCRLEKLKLSDCSISKEGYKALASALRSNPSHLIELDLTGNDPGQSGVKELHDLLHDEHCKLTIRFLKSPAALEACEYLTKVLVKSPLLLTELDLSEDKLGDLDGEKLSALLMDSHSKVEKIKLNNCEQTEKSCSVLATVLSSKTILKELNLNNSRLLDSGVREICEGLKNPVCELEILKLSDCSITEEGYKALASALRSNPSHLIELDLTGNDPGQSGVKELNDLLQNQNCQLKTLRFLGPAADEACQYLIGIMGKNPLILRELNLSECELKDTRVHQIAALLKDKHCKLNTLILNNSDITAEDCCVLTEALNTNPSNLTELNLSGTKLRDSGMKIFSTLFENEQCRLEKLKIKCISITAEGCAALTSAFNSNPSNLIELDLSGNKLGNSGVTQISTLLGNSECALQILRLSICSITEEGYKALASALRSNPSHLIELDLTGNDPGQSGVKELDDLLQDQNCQLKTLRFLGPEADKACQYIRGIVGENPLLLRALNLSERKLRDTRVNQIAALLKDKHCTVNTLMLNNNSITAEGCVALTSAFNSNPSNLKELDLSGNKLRNLGIKKICHLLENIQCRLEKLKLSDCSISKEGYKALASALRSNPSHLIELDLTGNDPGQSGVKELHDLLHDEHCKLTIRFLKSPAALEACEYLTKVLVKSPLLLTELDLSEDKLGDLDGEKLSALLMDSHSKVEKIKLNNCEQTEKSCSVLATVLSSKTILKELNLNNSRLLDSGVREICEGLKNPVCELEILKLSDCSITEEGYKALASALRSNPSHLIELDLTGNDPGQSGVKELDDLLQDPNFQLKTLRLLQSPNAEEACKYLTEDLHIKNLLLLKELNLSEHELGDTRVNQIAALLKDKHCKLNTLMMHNCGLTEESCSALATVLTSNSSLKELDISNNNLQDSGVNKLQNALENTNCTLEKLRLSDCNITEEGYKALASALRSNSSHLIELDLTGNDPGQSGVKELNDLLQDPECQLKTLRFLGTEADKACQYVRGIVGENPLLLRDLNLSGSKLGDTQVNQIAALLQDKHCTVNTLMLNNNSITAEGCAALTSAFNSNPSNLIELDLSGNKLGNSGIKKICHLLKNTQCRLEKLKLSDCSITEEGYKDLVSALRSNPSHLIELDLTGNDPGRSGVKELDDLLQVEHCSLKTIRFLKSPAAQEACEHLTKVLGKSPLLLTELDLSEDKLGDLDGVKLSDLLMDSHSKVEKIKLNNCEQTEKSCSVLATVLSSKTILKELNLNNSRLLDSGVKEICEGLKKSTLKILKLSECSIREEGYKALASALRSNPSHLIELDLTGNDPGQSGVEHLINVQKTLCHSLKTLRILQSPAADEACQYVREILGKNPLFLNELNLSGHKLGDTRVNQIAALLQDKHCTVNTLILRNCGLTEESCSALAAVLRSNSSLKELDISKNNLQNSGVKKLQNGLEHKNCTLEKLRLSECSIREEGYKALASALRSNPSHLIELDLTGNDPGQSGVKELDDLLQDENCELKNLRILRSPTAEEACKYLTELLGKNPLLLRELNLSGCELGDTRVNQIAALLQDKHCQFNTLTLCGCSITENQCNTLTKALFPNLSHLRELDLSGNQLKNTGAKHLSGVLKDSRCQLERLRLRGCDMTDKGCSAVTSALKSNPSHLRELDLSGNEPGDSGFKDLSDLLKNPQCKLENLQLRGCHMTDEGCSAVTSALKSNPSHLRELDLSGNKLGDSGFKNLSDLLKNPQCKLENLQLCKCNIQEKQCISLTSALKSNPSHLRELNLSGNVLRHTRVKHFYDLLKDSRCKLERLRLRSCDITAEDCSAVTSALKSDPSHLRELDLSGNELGDSGVDNLGFVLSSSQCKLEKLHLCSCSITEKQCLILTQHLCYNLSHLRELDFSGNQIENKGVNHLCEVLMNPRCKLERLSLNECGITDVSSLAQSLTNTKALQFLKELDLSKNNIGSSRQQLIDLIKDSSCNLSLEKEGWSSWNTAANVFSGIGGLFTWSKAQEEPVKSTAQEKPPSDERSSEGKLEEGEKQEFLV
ncbi:uncharacterized protein LOC127500029 isoform X8 [Ctenopharyngodon idella]|uniref:uncharacterized protein LOC127500029 isoform X8 n=1 Tax=Ctenopharyngodon idella TaxID=7959 RepID=UPI00222FED62|nr:uncharacterized protein LOC127500029 isoform X8 [Ctenopharyngodon idella]